MNRRSFLAGILAAGVAPAIVRVSSLMPVRRPLAVVTMEEVIEYGLQSPLIRINYGRLLWPGVKFWYDGVYSEPRMTLPYNLNLEEITYEA